MSGPELRADRLWSHVVAAAEEKKGHGSLSATECAAVRQSRKSQKWGNPNEGTVDDLSSDLGESRAFYSKEKGKRSRPRAELLQEHFLSSAQARGVTAAQTEEDYAKLMKDGFVILERLISPEEVERVRQSLQPHLGHGPSGDVDDFYGKKTKRLKAVFNKSPLLGELVSHPRILALANRVLEPNYILNDCQLIEIYPGSKPQPLHYDADLFPTFVRGGQEIVLASHWSFCEFTEQNGATRLLPNSHRWGMGELPDDFEVRFAEMPIGSCALWLGTTYHSGGGNTSPDPRLSFLSVYSSPYMRQLENFTLSIRRDVARMMSPITQALLGYSMTLPFFGSVDGRAPWKMLEMQEFELPKEYGK